MTSDPPGVPLLPSDEWDDGTRDALTAYLRRPELFRDGSRPMPNAFELFARHLPLGTSWLGFNEVLVKETALAPALRELVVLRVAWCTRSEYEWHQHTRIALASGLTTEHLHAIPSGADSAVWTAQERLILEAVDQLIATKTVDDEVSARLGEAFTPAEHLELLFIAGAYLCFAVITNASRLRPDPPTEPVDAPVLPTD